MIERAVFLRDPVNAFTRNTANLVNLTLSNKEWNQAEILLSILLPFKLVSDQLEQTKHPVIEHVFWSYETMFNQIDIIEAKLRRGREPWLKELQKSVLAMTKKLKDYYAQTVEAWVYSDGVLLNPWIKAGLFKNPSWRDDTGIGPRNISPHVEIVTSTHTSRWFIYCRHPVCLGRRENIPNLSMIMNCFYKIKPVNKQRMSSTITWGCQLHHIHLEQPWIGGSVMRRSTHAYLEWQEMYWQFRQQGLMWNENSESLKK